MRATTNGAGVPGWTAVIGMRTHRMRAVHIFERYTRGPPSYTRFTRALATCKRSLLHCHCDPGEQPLASSGATMCGHDSGCHMVWSLACHAQSNAQIQKKCFAPRGFAMWRTWARGATSTWYPGIGVATTSGRATPTAKFNVRFGDQVHACKCSVL